MPPTRRPPNDKDNGLPEVKVCGVHACRAVFRARPDDILRVYVRDTSVTALGDVLSALAKQRRPYKVIPNDELERLTDSTHHEGVCFVVRAKPPLSLDDILQGHEPQCVLALTDVANPHNVGAILRTAAHFGAQAAILGGGARVSAAALRTAQGGGEAVKVVSTNDWAAALASCRAAGYTLCATSSHARNNVFETRFPKKIVVLVGSEAHGLPDEVSALADLRVTVPGTGQVESLNVAAATAVVLGEWWRQRHQSDKATTAVNAPAAGKPPRGPRR
ncbi:MAG: TrmH family RNA methyltransferase [Deltaproteobacteria bacterium]|nr:TrmH family RNA methyltransferase [Deltaproteobacteria bacterium]